MTRTIPGSINGLAVLEFSALSAHEILNTNILYEKDINVINALFGTFSGYARYFLGGEAAFNPAYCSGYRPDYNGIDIMVVGAGPLNYANQIRGKGSFKNQTPIHDELRRETGLDFSIRENRSNDVFAGVAFTGFEFNLNESSFGRVSPIRLALATHKSFEEHLIAA